MLAKKFNELTPSEKVMVKGNYMETVLRWQDANRYKQYNSAAFELAKQYDIFTHEYDEADSNLINEYISDKEMINFFGDEPAMLVDEYAEDEIEYTEDELKLITSFCVNDMDLEESELELLTV